MKTKSELTTVLKVATALAGDKLPKVLELSQQLTQEGKSVDRALADALETLKCPTTVSRKKEENA